MRKIAYLTLLILAFLSCRNPAMDGNNPDTNGPPVGQGDTESPGILLCKYTYESGLCEPRKVLMDGDRNFVILNHQYYKAGTDLRSNVNITHYDSAENKASNVILDDMRWSIGQDIAMDHKGNVCAIWDNLETGSNGLIQSIRGVFGRSDSGFPDAPDDICPGQSGDNWSNPKLAFDSRSNIIAVWNDGLNLFTRRYESGSGWGNLNNLTRQFNSGVCTYPVLKFYGDNAVLLYEDEGIQVLRYTAGPGRGWSSFATTLNNSRDQILSPDWYVAVSENGNYAVAVWSHMHRSNGSYNLVAYANYCDNGQWLGAFVIDTPEMAMDRRNLHAVIDNDGNATVLWRKNGKLLSRRYGNGSGWQSPEKIGNASGGTLFLCSENAVLALWADDRRICVKTRKPGESWSDTRVPLHSKKGFDRLAAAMNENDDIVLTWIEHMGGDVYHYAQFIDSAGNVIKL